jgi:hypothetical protein
LVGSANSRRTMLGVLSASVREVSSLAKESHPRHGLRFR